jgi:hypothetical protein
MMKVGIYGKPSRQPMLFRFAEGVDACGHRPIFRNPAPFTSDQVEDFDLVVLLGGPNRWNGRNHLLRQCYEERGIDCLVIEGGYFSRDGKRWAVGINSHYWIPPFECPDDRMKAAGIEIEPQEPGEYILVCGQRPEIDVILRERAVCLRRFSKREIVFRPHPRQPSELPEADRVSEGSLNEDLAGAAVIVVHTSNVGNEAIRRRVPVICSPEAMFSRLASPHLEAVENLRPPPLDAVRRYFARLSYAQWTEAEFADGSAFDFYLRTLAGEEPEIPESEPTVYETILGAETIEELRDIASALGLSLHHAVKKPATAKERLIAQVA